MTVSYLAVVGIGDAGAAVNHATTLIRAVVTLVTNSHQRARAHVSEKENMCARSCKTIALTKVFTASFDEGRTSNLQRKKREINQIKYITVENHVTKRNP